MRLIMIPYAVDENCPPLAFVPNWIRAISQHVQRLHVIAPWVGEHAPFAEHVSLYSLHKDQGVGKLARLKSLYSVLWRILHEEGADVCFVHMHTAMTPIIWPLLRMHRVPIVSWYAHGHVDRTVPLTHLLSSAMTTSCLAAYTYRRDEKLHIIGQGIDENIFHLPAQEERGGIVSVGRISPVKQLEVLLQALAILKRNGRPLACTLVGDAPEEHRFYKSGLETMVRELDICELVHFAGAVSNVKAAEYYRSAWLHVNCAPADNSMDKAVLEAAFCGALSLTSAEIYGDSYQELSKQLIFRASDAESLARCIEQLPPSGEEAHKALQQALLQKIATHSVAAFAKRLVSCLASQCRAQY